MGFANFADFTHFADFANFVIYAHFLDYNSFGGWPRPGWLSLKPGRLWPEAWLAGPEAYTTIWLLAGWLAGSEAWLG